MKLRDHIEKLHAFSAIARLGSITRAAKELALSQTALSHSLRILEEVLEVRLLIRTPQGVVLTESGQRLYDYSQRLAMDVDALELSVKAPADAHAGILRVGSHETFSIHLWPDFLDGFLQQYPSVHVSLISGRVDALLEGLAQRQYHLTVTVEPEAQKCLRIETLYRNQMRFYAAPAIHQPRFATLKPSKVTLAAIRDIPILTDTHAHLRQGLSLPRLLIQNGFREESFFELNSFEAAIKLAGKGLGLAFLPEKNARAAVQSGALREISVTGLPKGFGEYRTCAAFLKQTQTSH